MPSVGASGFVEAIFVKGRGRSRWSQATASTSAICGGVVEIVLGNGRRFRIEGGLDDAQLVRLVRLLEAI